MRMATCHSDRKHYGRGLCQQCCHAAYYAAHIEEAATYRSSHREKQRAYDVTRHVANKEKDNIRCRVYGAARNIALKLEALDAYGGPRCTCCGETLIGGLTLDHMNGDGAKWRKEHDRRGGARLYLWLKKHDYPPGHQVLCATCNLAKGTGDHCPHRDAA